MGGSKALLPAALIVMSTACTDASPSPFSPVTPTAITAPARREGVPIEVGQVVTGTLTPSDPSCGNELSPDPPEPCQLFVLNVRERGVVTVQVDTPGTGPLSLRVNQARQWGQGIHITFEVQVGFRYEIGVALHDGPRAADQRFELVTSFAPE